MRIDILSDLHLESAPWVFLPATADLIVLAGDISDRTPLAVQRRADLMEISTYHHSVNSGEP